ncbi:CpsD/CapB family tyrosine-protein kinase [Ruminiclostridium herbifermentans]|uniref:non-specific protein-tyrosine kinase n=1 Tax=Ruminiclostridium herbifermentans TaxID=2488810 RepID=A0A4U7JK72_9FIRM|nr:CpsD/CapB family tyrosine-protein kinase [Ruminiclostridium herbifermentans]QNU66628.1 CpsD/CapB family tyrosine-protein kinase [Ruminiclostridium herbifermentans]
MANIRFHSCLQENQAVRDAYSMLSGNIHLGKENKDSKSIVITSSEPKAGKTSIAVNLAITLAIWGKKTILVDADMRKETTYVSIPKWVSNLGLAQYLSGHAEYEEIICYTNIEGFKYLPNGGVALNPIGNLCSERFNTLLERLKEEFEYIIFDSPSLDTISDAVIISTKVDSAILVAKIGKSNLKAIKRSKEKLEKVNANILGVVINDVSKKHYKQYLSSYKYLYNARCKNEKNEKPSKNAVLA